MKMGRGKKSSEGEEKIPHQPSPHKQRRIAEILQGGQIRRVKVLKQEE
jgi:hypothetical protein